MTTKIYLVKMWSEWTLHFTFLSRLETFWIYSHLFFILLKMTSFSLLVILDNFSYIFIHGSWCEVVEGGGKMTRNINLCWMIWGDVICYPQTHSQWHLLQCLLIFSEYIIEMLPPTAKKNMIVTKDIRDFRQLTQILHFKWNISFSKKSYLYKNV